MEKMYVNEKSFEVIKLLGHGKGDILIWLRMGRQYINWQMALIWIVLKKEGKKWQFLKFKIFQRKNLRELKR